MVYTIYHFYVIIICIGDVMNKEIYGYKSFNNDGTNYAGIVMPPGVYHCDGDIIYRNNGFHFAKRLEDTFRYRDMELEEPLIAEVIGFGTIVEGRRLEDDYYGYFDLYACSDINIIKYLTHEEIVEYGLSLPEYRIERFITSGILSEEELEIFANISSYNRSIVDRFMAYKKNKMKTLIKGDKYE